MLRFKHSCSVRCARDPPNRAWNARYLASDLAIQRCARSGVRVALTGRSVHVGTGGN